MRPGHVPALLPRRRGAMGACRRLPRPKGDGWRCAERVKRQAEHKIAKDDPENQRQCQAGDLSSGAHRRHPAKPTRRRKRTPSIDPRNADPAQTQPCRLPVEMPLKNAPTLQPKASREL